MEETKVQKYFGGMCVKKDASIEQFAILAIPSFIRDWFLRKYANEDGSINVTYISQLIKQTIPRKADWPTLLDKMVTEGETVKFICKIQAKQDVRTGIISFELPDFGVGYNETTFPLDVWAKCKAPFLSSNGPIWGVVELRFVVDSKKVGKISIKNFVDFRPYKTDLDYYKKGREYFDIHEWIDLLLGAIDYNPAGFKSEEEKIYLLTRLLPFVEKRLNVIELAPKGTGKSYVFSKISKFGWLASGGIMTRAKMFYDMQIKQEGLVSNYDYVALDEVATIKFGDINEMQGAMKGYLESGVYTVGVKEGKGDAGVILLGNISEENMNTDCNMLSKLPEVFGDSALIDRFHGFIEGWKIPRMSEDKKINDWALNTEYFAEIMHALREDIIPRSIVDALIKIKDGADTRDVTAVKRICCAYIKLLFPNWTKPEDVDTDLFEKYCLNPAINMRGIIKKQLGLMDSEFSGKKMPEITIVKPQVND